MHYDALCLLPSLLSTKLHVVYSLVIGNLCFSAYKLAWLYMIRMIAWKVICYPRWSSCNQHIEAQITYHCVELIGETH